jgi:hypothetical protein
MPSRGPLGLLYGHPFTYKETVSPPRGSTVSANQSLSLRSPGHVRVRNIKYISTDKKAIPLLVIIPSVMIIEIWFYKKITRHKFMIISPSSYTNESIYIL